MDKTKKKFSFISHPADLHFFKKYMHYLKPNKTFRDELVLKLFEWAPAYKLDEFHDLSLDGKTSADSIFIMIPFIPEMRDIRLKKVIEKIEDGIRISSESGCSIASLGGFASIILQGREKEISEKYNITLTSGNAFTSACIITSIEKLAQRLTIPLHEVTMAIIGASGDIGSACMRYFGTRVKKLLLTARSLQRLGEIAKKNRGFLTVPFAILDDNKKVMEEASFIIFVTSSYSSLFDYTDFKPGTIICDASAPFNVSVNSVRRPDTLLYHGGVCSMPFTIDLGFDVGLASTSYMYGCFIEGLLLCLYDYLPCSWGRGNITPDKVDQFLELFNKHPALNIVYSLEDYTYTPYDIEVFKTCIVN
jgi:fatty aldehyde-generating acyl-ACP reductase